MKIKLFSVALGIAFSATTIAQEMYKQGVVTYSTSLRGLGVEIKEYFTVDSSAVTFTQGPSTITALTDADHKSFVLLLNIPTTSLKKAVVLTPEEVNEQMADFPTFTFALGTETKQISGFNCSKVIATDTKDNKTYEVWITNDIAVPPGAIPLNYKDIGGFPVQYVGFEQGQSTIVTISSVSGVVPPAGIFSIPADFERISRHDLMEMSGGN